MEGDYSDADLDRELLDWVQEHGSFFKDDNDRLAGGDLSSLAGLERWAPDALSANEDSRYPFPFPMNDQQESQQQQQQEEEEEEEQQQQQQQQQQKQQEEEEDDQDDIQEFGQEVSIPLNDAAADADPNEASRGASARRTKSQGSAKSVAASPEQPTSSTLYQALLPTKASRQPSLTKDHKVVKRVAGHRVKARSTETSSLSTDGRGEREDRGSSRGSSKRGAEEAAEAATDSKVAQKRRRRQPNEAESASHAAATKSSGSSRGHSRGAKRSASPSELATSTTTSSSAVGFAPNDAVLFDPRMYPAPPMSLESISGRQSGGPSSQSSSSSWISGYASASTGHSSSSGGLGEQRRPPAQLAQDLHAQQLNFQQQQQMQMQQEQQQHQAILQEQIAREQKEWRMKEQRAERRQVSRAAERAQLKAQIEALEREKSSLLKRFEATTTRRTSSKDALRVLHDFQADNMQKADFEAYMTRFMEKGASWDVALTEVSALRANLKPTALLKLFLWALLQDDSFYVPSNSKYRSSSRSSASNSGSSGALSSAKGEDSEQRNAESQPWMMLCGALGTDLSRKGSKFQEMRLRARSLASQIWLFNSRLDKLQELIVSKRAAIDSVCTKLFGQYSSTEILKMLKTVEEQRVGRPMNAQAPSNFFRSEPPWPSEL